MCLPENKTTLIFSSVSPSLFRCFLCCVVVRCCIFFLIYTWVPRNDMSTKFCFCVYGSRTVRSLAQMNECEFDDVDTTLVGATDATIGTSSHTCDLRRVFHSFHSSHTFNLSIVYTENGSLTQPSASALPPSPRRQDPWIYRKKCHGHWIVSYSIGTHGCSCVCQRAHKGLLNTPLRVLSAAYGRGACVCGMHARGDVGRSKHSFRECSGTLCNYLDGLSTARAATYAVIDTRPEGRKTSLSTVTDFLTSDFRLQAPSARP